MRQALPEHGTCLVCGKENPHGMGLTWYVEEDGSIFASFILSEAQQGPPGHAHGGAAAAILDEAMGAAVWYAGYNVAVVHLSLDYRKPLPLHQPLSCRARMERQDGRKLHASGEIYLPDGTVAVRARGIFVPAPHLFEQERYRIKTVDDRP